MKHPTTMVIFGATGDLSRTKIFPALRHLAKKAYLPNSFRIVAYARKNFTDKSYREQVREQLVSGGHGGDDEMFEKIIDSISFVQGEFDILGDYKNLAEVLERIDHDEFGVCSNKMFYLAVPPNHYMTILDNISKSGLAIPCIEKSESGEMGGWSRILVEKPFGRDVDTAITLDKHLGQLFGEDQIFRIDHYLAKETLQNILSFRFSNAMFEPLWNREHVEKIELEMTETKVVGSRGKFYDDIGALRDVGQNHMLQMLALICMERPISFDSQGIRNARAEVLENVQTIVRNEKPVFQAGQYEGYLSEEGVLEESQTETAFILGLELCSGAMKGVPIVLTSGKGLSKAGVSITVTFKPSQDCVCGLGGGCSHRNKLVFKIQPDESIRLYFWTKKPGFGFEVEESRLDFRYGESSDNSRIPDAYERVLYDCISGDQTLFASTRELEASWRLIGKVLESKRQSKNVSYKVGADINTIFNINNG